jgi:hypothetical protein
VEAWGIVVTDFTEEPAPSCSVYNKEAAESADTLTSSLIAQDHNSLYRSEYFKCHRIYKYIYILCVFSARRRSDNVGQLPSPLTHRRTVLFQLIGPNSVRCNPSRASNFQTSEDGYSKTRSQNCKKRLFASCLSPRPHGTTRLPLDRFSWNLIFEYFSISCRYNSCFIKIGQE